MIKFLRERGLLISIAAFVVLSLLFAVPFFTAIVEMAGVLGMIIVDSIFGALLTPRAPWAMFVICGAFVGLCASFWLIAPAYDLKKYRKLAGYAPLVMLSALMVLSICMSI